MEEREEGPSLDSMDPMNHGIGSLSTSGSVPVRVSFNFLAALSFHAHCCRPFPAQLQRVVTKSRHLAVVCASCGNHSVGQADTFTRSRVRNTKDPRKPKRHRIEAAGRYSTVQRRWLSGWMWDHRELCCPKNPGLRWTLTRSE